MVIGVASAFVQKGRESAVAVAVAKRIASGVRETQQHRNEVEYIISSANRWQAISLLAVIAAMGSWRIAVSRHERLCGSWAIIVSLLALWIGLQLLMV